MANTEWEVVDETGDQFRRAGADRHNTAKNLRWVAELLDSRFNILGIRLGWDAILGLVPGLGDLATNAASFYIMIQASNLGASPSVILRMGLNLIVDNLLDAIPFLGNFMDIFWRANLKNVNLLERYLENPRRTTVSSRWVVVLTLAGVLVTSLLSIICAIYLAVLVFNWLAGHSQGW